jgi:D-arabinose 1-dehydrogenase-like Zn-dependent alcohol dehydrogenase
MRANCWYGKKDVRVETVPDPKILNRRDAVVKISSTPICGSDLHLYNGFIPTMERGDILGHEFMGEIMEVGPDVRRRAAWFKRGSGKRKDEVLGELSLALLSATFPQPAQPHQGS